MSKQSDTVYKVISTLAKAPIENLKPETELVAELGIDSPKALQLIVEIEDELGIEISDDDAAEMKTIADVLAFCSK